MSYFPKISVIIPVYNSETCIALCLDSLFNQVYPREKLEVIIVDAGSKDKTLDIVRRYKIDLILENPLKTGEAGKSVGVQHAKNDIIALIDSDNILLDQNWLKMMVEPFGDDKICGTEPWAYAYRPEDPLITRYCALLGMNDPLCYYLGNYDRLCSINNQWTGMDVATEDCGNYLKVNLENITVYPTMGANGFMIRRNLILKTQYQPYLFDIDLISQLVPLGDVYFAKVKTDILHLYAKNLMDFSRKQKRRIKDYLFYKDKQQRFYPWDKVPKRKLYGFVIKTLLVIPITYDAIKGYSKVSDRAWWFHIPACWATLTVYGMGRLAGIMRGSHNIMNREKWNR